MIKSDMSRRDTVNRTTIEHTVGLQEMACLEQLGVVQGAS
jgi:hypothetical protein